METNFSNGPSHRFGDVLFRGQKIVCVQVCQRKAKSHPLDNVLLRPKNLCTSASESAQIAFFGYVLFSQRLVCVLAYRKVVKLLASVVLRNCMLGVGQAAICQRLAQQYTYNK